MDHLYTSPNKRSFSTFSNYSSNQQTPQESLMPSPKRSFESFATDQVHYQHVLKPATPVYPCIESASQKIDSRRSPGPETTNNNNGRQPFDTEKMNESPSIPVSDQEELLRMCPDMIPLQQKAEEIMSFSQELFNDTFGKAFALINECYNSVGAATVARQQLVSELLQAIFAQRSENIKLERALNDLRKKTAALSSTILN